MSGSWSGTATALGVTATLDLTLSEADDGSVTGTAHLDLGTFGTTDGPVTGNHEHPSVTLIAQTDTAQATFDGAFSDANTVPGAVSVPGLPAIPLTLRRQ
jgi:hypothetical protein